MRGDQFARWKLARAVEASRQALPKTELPQKRIRKDVTRHDLNYLQPSRLPLFPREFDLWNRCGLTYLNFNTPTYTIFAGRISVSLLTACLPPSDLNGRSHLIFKDGEFEKDSHNMSVGYIYRNTFFSGLSGVGRRLAMGEMSQTLLGSGGT